MRVHRSHLVLISAILALALCSPNSEGEEHEANAARTGPKVQKGSPEPVSEQQVTNIPYFTLRDGMDSTLTLNNLASTPTAVRVTLFNGAGRGHVLSPITVPTHSFKQIDLRDVVPGEDFNDGNIEVAFSGPPMILTCQVSIYSLDKRVSFESREQDMMDFMSSNLNGILWLPQDGAEGFMAVTNVATKKVTVQFAVGPDKQAYVLAPRETRMVKLNEDRHQPTPLVALLKLQHNGMPGDVITTGFVLNLKKGYSSSIPMVDPSIIVSNKLAGTHFRFGAPDQSEGFPAGTTFRAPLLLANVGSHPVNAHVSVDYTMKEQIPMTPWAADASEAQTSTLKAGTMKDRFSTLAVKDVTIAPGNVQAIELSEELVRLGITDPVEEAGVDIAYEAAPGTVIGQLTSFDQTGDYAFEVPIKDPSAVNEMMEGVYPWTIENGTQSVLHLKNTTADTVSALMLLDFPSGELYNPTRIVLQPYQSIAIDIQKLKNSKQLDVLRRPFPVDGTHGQVQWHQEIPYSMIGRMEETDPTAGIAKSFSCGYACCQNFYEYAWISGGPIEGNVEDSATLSAGVAGRYCNAIPFSNPVATTWSSQDTNVATVNSGSVSLVGGGTTTILAGPFRIPDYYMNFDSRCVVEYSSQTPKASVKVHAPKSLQVLGFTVLPTGTGTTDHGCTPTQDYGIELDIRYQVLDDRSPPQPVKNATMVPHEHIVSGSQSSDEDICPSRISTCLHTTDGNGIFHDAPLGGCFNGAFSASLTQDITIILNGKSYPVRTNNFTVSSSSVTHGTITNGSDIQATR